MELIDFNPRSREGSDRVEKESRRRMCYFNPRSREGSDYVVRLWCHEYAISIHAPARGATIYISGLIFVPVISIHAPARGATFTPPAFLSASSTISIHAPARGATYPSLAAHSRNVYFNPRSREGSDTQDVAKSAHNTDFNPRSREGSDIDAGARLQLLKISIHAPARGATFRFHPIH